MTRASDYMGVVRGSTERKIRVKLRIWLMLCLGTQKACSGVVDPSEAYDLLKFITLLTEIVF